MQCVLSLGSFQVFIAQVLRECLGTNEYFMMCMYMMLEVFVHSAKSQDLPFCLPISYCAETIQLQASHFVFPDHKSDQCMYDNGRCHSNAECSNVNNTAECTCKNGFSGNGVLCTGPFGIFIYSKTSGDSLMAINNGETCGGIFGMGLLKAKVKSI